MSQSVLDGSNRNAFVLDLLWSFVAEKMTSRLSTCASNSALQLSMRRVHPIRVRSHRLQWQSVHQDWKHCRHAQNRHQRHCKELGKACVDARFVVVFDLDAMPLKVEKKTSLEAQSHHLARAGAEPPGEPCFKTARVALT